MLLFSCPRVRQRGMAVFCEGESLCAFGSQGRGTALKLSWSVPRTLFLRAMSVVALAPSRHSSFCCSREYATSAVPKMQTTTREELNVFRTTRRSPGAHRILYKIVKSSESCLLDEPTVPSASAGYFLLSHRRNSGAMALPLIRSFPAACAP